MDHSPNCLSNFVKGKGSGPWCYNFTKVAEGLTARNCTSVGKMFAAEILIELCMLTRPAIPREIMGPRLTEECGALALNS